LKKSGARIRRSFLFARFVWIIRPASKLLVKTKQSGCLFGSRFVF